MTELLYAIVAMFAAVVYTVWFMWLLRKDGVREEGDFGISLMVGVVSGIFWMMTLPIAVIAIAAWTLTSRMTER